MANDGKIYITISDRRFGRNKAEADEQNERDKEQKNKEDFAGDFAKHQFFSMIKSQAKSAVNYTVNNIGNFTGDYIKQSHASTALEIVNLGIEFGTAAIAGAKMGGGYGAIAAVAIVAVGKAINFGEQTYAGIVELGKQNRKINQLRERAGLDGSTNGSRGTEY